MVHFDGLHFSSNGSRGEGDNHSGLNDTSFDTTDWDCSNTTDLVNILEGKTKGLVLWADRRFNGINSIEKGLSFNYVVLNFLSPTLVPRSAKEVIGDKNYHKQGEKNEVLDENLLGGLVDHVVTVETGDGDEGNSLGVVTNLLDEVGSFLDDFLETLFIPLKGVKFSFVICLSCENLR